MSASNDRSAIPQTADDSSSEPLGLKHPLLPAPALGQRVLMPQFTAPLGARSLMPTLPATPEYAPTVSFADSPFFAVSRSSLPIQPKRSTVAPILMEAPSIDQPTSKERIRDRQISEQLTLQRFSEPIPSQTSPIEGDEAPTVPSDPIHLPNKIADGTMTDGSVEVTSAPEASPPIAAHEPPTAETTIEPSPIDWLEHDRTRSEPLPTAIEPSSIANVQAQQNLSATDFGADQYISHSEGDSVPPPSLQRSLEATTPTRELSPDASPLVSADSLSSLPSHTTTPSGADTDETAPSPIPVIQPRLDSPLLTPPLNPPQSNQERVHHETALFATVPIQETVQETPEQSASPLQRQVDSLPIENSEEAVLPVNHAIAPASDALPAFTDSPLPDSPSPSSQTQVEATSKDPPRTQVIPAAVSPESMPAQLSLEQVSDASVDSIPRSEPPMGTVPNAPISPVVQRSPTEPLPSLQAHDRPSNKPSSNEIPLKSEPTEETAIPNSPASTIEAALAPAHVTNALDRPPHPISPTVEPSLTAESTVSPTVESPQLEHSPIPSSTVSPQGSDSEASTLQLKQAEFDQSAFLTQVEPEASHVEPINHIPHTPVGDAAEPFTGAEPISAPMPTIAHPPDESYSAPITPTGSDPEAVTSPTLQAFPSPAPIAPPETLAATSPSPLQPSIQRQTAPDMAVLPSNLPEQQIDDRPPVSTTIQSERSVTHGNPATKADSPFAFIDPDAIGVSSPPVIQASTAEAMPSESTTVQARPEPGVFPPLPKALQNLAILNPLGNANPLVQPSRLTAPPSQAEETVPANLQLKAMQPVTERSPHTALNGSFNQVGERQAEAHVQVATIAPQKRECFPSPATTPPSQTANVPIELAPDAWSSIDELLGRSPMSPIIQRFVDVPQADSISNLNQQDTHRFDQPQGYQPLRDMPSGAPPMDSPSGDTSLPSITSEVPARTEAMEPASETQAGAQVNQASKAKDEADKLDELAREIYQLLRQRFEIERERYGTYYPNRF